MDAQLIAPERLSHVPAPIQHVLAQVKRDLVGFYGDRLQQLILFGSYARGDFHEESDIDLMPLLTYTDGSTWDEKERLFDLTYSYFEQDYTKVSVLPVTVTEYLSSDRFLLQFVRQDGLSI